MVNQSIRHEQLIVRALCLMVTIGNFRGWLRSSLAVSFLIAALLNRKRHDMAASNKRKVIYKQQAQHQYSSRGGKLLAGLDLVIFDNGDIEFSVLKPLTFRHKPKIEISNADIAKIETSTSPGNYTHVSIKITDSKGNVEAVRPLMIGFKNKRSAIVAKLPVILSSLYAERYTKL